MDCLPLYDRRPCTLPSSFKGKKGGGKRGKALKLSTDTQSIAARERRHRISERFKILQSLVPGGSKMDTVSMLDEAIHYVKFLKTQIWLHQTMIDFVDADDHSLLLPPKPTAHLCEQVNMVGETYALAALPQLGGFAHSGSGPLQCGENIPLDETLLY
ncbi:hypothetical protein ACH5RR_005190 [Cinchona calisaya]|uniref:BHLH domain-containing protein n=1 Tax=Cinchona calisaya TaxID=153742 RepID=A0ABD3AKI3_9GENT